MRNIIFLLLLSFNATAALYDRGNGLIYDDVLDITWLQDANYAQTSGYDNDGKMSWADASAWSSNLSFGNAENWRLPIINTPDPTCSIQNGDISYGTGCEAGEFSSLYNTGTAPTIFSNIQTGYYWSETAAEGAFFTYRFIIGHQGYAGTAENFVWAVHDGDIGNPIPVPAGIYLFLSGIVSLGLTRGVWNNK